MRTTLDIDDDILQAVKELARAEGRTAGKVLSELARRALTQAPSTGFSEEAAPMIGFVKKDGFYQLPNRDGVVVTKEMVDRLVADADEEEARRKGGY